MQHRGLPDSRLIVVTIRERHHPADYRGTLESCINTSATMGSICVTFFWSTSDILREQRSTLISPSRLLLGRMVLESQQYSPPHLPHTIAGTRDSFSSQASLVTSKHSAGEGSLN